MKNSLKRAIRNQLELIQSLTHCADTIFIHSNQNTILSNIQENTIISQQKTDFKLFDFKAILKKTVKSYSLNNDSFGHIKSLILFHNIDIFPIQLAKDQLAYVLILFNNEGNTPNKHSIEIICENIASFYKAYEDNIATSKNSLASDLLLNTIHGVPWSLDFTTTEFFIHRTTIRAYIELSSRRN